MITIKFKYKRVYGKPKFYPDNNIAETFCKVAERTCLSTEHFLHILMLRKQGALIEVFDSEDKLLSGAELIEVLGL